MKPQHRASAMPTGMNHDLQIGSPAPSDSILCAAMAPTTDGSHPFGAAQDELAAALLHHAGDHREAEPRPFANILSGEKRVDRLREGLLVHTLSFVAYGEADILAGCKAAPSLSLLQTGSNKDPASARHRVAGIQGKVQQAEFKLSGVGLDVFEDEGKLRVDRHAGPPIVRCSSSAIPCTSFVRSTASSRRSCLRAKASIRCVSVAPRSAACMMLSRTRVMSLPSANRLLAMSTLPRWPREDC